MRMIQHKRIRLYAPDVTRSQAIEIMKGLYRCLGSPFIFPAPDKVIWKQYVSQAIMDWLYDHEYAFKTEKEARMREFITL